jgi:hypothetical protein
VLGERPGRELVLGGIGKYHRVLNQEPVPLRDVVSWLLLRAVRRRAQAAGPFGP